eukprot:5006504-Alexandrium_andersonii.AAC.1
MPLQGSHQLDLQPHHRRQHRQPRKGLRGADTAQFEPNAPIHAPTHDRDIMCAKGNGPPPGDPPGLPSRLRYPK